MLEQLKLNNLALSVQAEVDFTPGMICITGETGAGKSLVVDALGLVLGAKADANMVRQGEKQLEVSALFTVKELPHVRRLLASYGFLSQERRRSAPAAVGITPAPAVGTTPVPTPAAAAAAADVPAAVAYVSPAGDINASAPVALVADAVTAGNDNPGAGAAADNEELRDSNISCAVVADGHAVGIKESLAPVAVVATVTEMSASVRTEGTAGTEKAAGADAAVCKVAADDDGDDDLVLRRIVTADGKSKAYINGHMATLAQLRELSESLVAIHGQHASVRLMDEKNQLEIVDNYGKLKELVNQVNGAFNQYSRLRSDLTALSEQQKTGAAEYRQNRYDFEELKRLDLHAGDYEELDAMFDRAIHQAQFSTVLANLRNMIEGGDSNIISILREQMAELDKVKNFDPGISRIMDSLDAAIMHLDESASYAADLGSASSEMSTTELEARMSKAHELARRFSCLPNELYLMTEKIELKVSEFLGLKERINKLTQEVVDARKQYESLALELTQARRQSASELSRRIGEKITELALPDARFDIVLTRDEESKPRLNGRDNLCFMFSANLGQELRPLSAVASGGELSRLALTIEVLTASVKSTPTLIFDEVDTGISGRTASAVGSLLRELGHYVQVITVTHLPQVAAKADTQFVVAKYNEDGQVNSTITSLDDNGRIEEISRMIGGSVITDTTRRSAYELLHD